MAEVAKDLLVSTIGKFVTPLVRAALFALAGVLVSNGVYAQADADALIGQASSIAMGLVTLLATYGWSVWQKHIVNQNGEKLFNAAMSAPPTTPRVVVEANADVAASAL